jgi:hypothetical protein
VVASGCDLNSFLVINDHKKYKVGICILYPWEI